MSMKSLHEKQLRAYSRCWECQQQVLCGWLAAYNDWPSQLYSLESIENHYFLRTAKRFQLALLWVQVNQENQKHLQPPGYCRCDSDDFRAGLLLLVLWLCSSSFSFFFSSPLIDCKSDSAYHRERVVIKGQLRCSSLHVGVFALAYQLGIFVDTHDMVKVMCRVPAI